MLQGDQVFVGIDEGTVVVGLADPATPQVVSTIASVGGRLAFTDARVLLGSMQAPTQTQHPLGGIRVAAFGPTAVIQDVEPLIVPTDLEGRTQAPLRIRYRVMGAPPDFEAGTVRLLRDAQMVASTPVPGLVDGTYEATLPAGVVLETPPETVEVSVESAEGDTLWPITLGVRNPTPGVVAASETAPLPVSPRLSSLTPGRAVAGAGPTVIVIQGTDLTGSGRSWRVVQTGCGTA